MKIIDNNNEKLIDSLIADIRSGDRVSIAATCFSMYAFHELAEKLNDVAELRFIFTSPMFKSGRGNHGNEDSFLGSEFEVKLKNELTQKAIAREFAEWLKRENVHIRSNNSEEFLAGFAVVQSSDKKATTAYTPLQSLTTVDLGTTSTDGVFNLITAIDAPFSKQYLDMFDSIWRDKKKLVDIKESVIKKIREAYADNSPEFVYYVALHNIFTGFLKDISDEDFFADERVGFKGSVVWNKLYDFQKDAALAIINKLERYNGCILADSVGLGKTFTALAVIKYYESRNKSVLVLCPKKLSENWNSFRGNFVNNPLFADRLRYDVLYHTDLNRVGKKGFSNGINLEHLNWSNYDLIVIDESHNFRNGGNSSNSEKMNRYQILLDKVIRDGVKTRVLMLSATPVNNRFNDLRNQLQLAYEDGDPAILESKLNSRNTIEGIFRKAQASFNKWSGFLPEKRTTSALLKMLDYDFFELLDSVTIARSRKQIRTYYDMNAIGAFPTRLAPLSLSPSLTRSSEYVDYDEIFDSLLSLSLAIYTPSHYIRQDRRYKYAKEFGDILNNKAFSQENREQGLRRLMAINLMKRLESSIHAFSLTLQRINDLISNTLVKIQQFQEQRRFVDFDANVFDMLAGEDDDLQEDFFSVGKKVKINFEDMNLDSWKKILMEDLAVIEALQDNISFIDAGEDNKLHELMEVIRNKASNPINGTNKKILIFTAFADTAEYLYQHISRFALSLGLNTAMVTGTGDGQSTIRDLRCDYHTLLTCFSPLSKERSVLFKSGAESTATIDILIGTDCISEGQNLQDCDYCVNYDIHWNPVRIIQRYGRIDRIGSQNERIQLVNFWPDVSLDEYINLKQKIETRMKIVNITATPEEQVLSDEEKIDLQYRHDQLERLRTEVVDIEDVSSNISISDLGLNEYKLDLLDLTKNKSGMLSIRTGVYAVTSATRECPPGMILVLKNVSSKHNIKTPNRLHPFYLVYIADNGTIVHNYIDSKETLTALRKLCKNNSGLDAGALTAFNAETLHGKDMKKYKKLLEKAVQSIIEVKKEEDINSLFRAGGTSFGKKEKIDGLDSFELICFLVVK